MHLNAGPHTLNYHVIHLKELNTYEYNNLTLM